MEASHPLKALLQLQLGSDANAVLHLPYILSSLTPACFEPSVHLQKWTTRISSLVHSKDSGARWAGLCIALRTAILSRALMIECAQGWVGAALPTLSKSEPNPTVKAAIRLLRHIFTSATDVPEFQRQLATPNVPKFSSTLITIGEKQEDQELKTLAIDTLSHLVPLYPTLHRALHSALSALVLRYLNGSTPRPTPIALVESASRLYSVLHHTGGKVGAANLWRKSLDDTLQFAWSSYMSLRTTFPFENGVHPPGPQPVSSEEDPVIAVPLNLDRIRAAVKILRELMQASNPRPVMLPIGSIVRFSVALLRCTQEENVEGHIDTTTHALEISVVPTLWALGCDLIDALACCARKHLTPHISQIFFYVVYHLEKQYAPSQRLPFLHATCALLLHCGPLTDTLLPSRLSRAILPSLTVIFSSQSDAQRDAEQFASGGGARGRKGKRKGRGYEGDEVFKVAREVICPAKDDGEVVLAALNAIELILLNAELSPAMHSVAARLLLSLFMILPQLPPSLLSSDTTLHGKLYESVSRISANLACGTTSTMSKSVGLIIGSSPADTGAQHWDLLLHPRVPPLVRSLPQIEALSLFRAEESQEETAARLGLGVGVNDAVHTPLALPLDTAKVMQPDHTTTDALGTGPPNPLIEPDRASSINPTKETKSTTVVSSSSLSRPVEMTIPPASPPAIEPLLAQQDPGGTQVPIAAPPRHDPVPSFATQAQTDTVAPVVPLMNQDDEDEPMPSINMDSDSD